MVQNDSTNAQTHKGGHDWDSIVAGSTAGLTSRFVIAPLDVVKIRQQLQVHHWKDASTVSGPTYRGIMSTMKTITRNEGMTALWKGNIPAEILYVTYGGAQFYSYQTVQNLLDSHLLALPHASHAFISGACAGGFATTITYPLDCLRTRFAAQGQERIYRSFSHSITHVYRHEGLSGYFRGLSTALLQIVPNLGIFFGLYEPLRQLYADTSPLALSEWGSAVAGGTAGVVAKTAVFPLDLLRKRLQVQGVTREMYVHKNIPIYHGVLGAFRTIVAQEGVRGLFKGLTPGLVKAAPNSAITMFVYEHVMTFLSQY